MDDKLILKLDKSVLNKAKEYALSHRRSLSHIIESYLKVLVEKESSEKDDNIKISPFVKSMQTGVKIPTDFDYKKEYGVYIAEKYQ